MSEDIFKKQLAEEFGWDEVEKNLSTGIFYVEKECNANITNTYPCIKFMTQLKELQAHQKRVKKEYDKMKSRRR